MHRSALITRQRVDLQRWFRAIAKTIAYDLFSKQTFGSLHNDSLLLHPLRKWLWEKYPWLMGKCRPSFPSDVCSTACRAKHFQRKLSSRHKMIDTNQRSAYARNEKLNVLWLYIPTECCWHLSVSRSVLVFWVFFAKNTICSAFYDM